MKGAAEAFVFGLGGYSFAVTNDGAFVIALTGVAASIDDWCPKGVLGSGSLNKILTLPCLRDRGGKLV
jgi:hypothetical protein